MTETSVSPGRFAVIGSPVAHSKSPGIHQAFAEQTGITLDYQAIEVAPEVFPAFVADFFQEGGRGLNVTVPHKEAAFAAAERCSDNAAQARAVNTLAWDASQGLVGHNTDGLGLVRDICENLGFSLENRSLLILGAGGACRGILPALLARNPGSITLANRSLPRAEAVRDDFSELAEIAVCDYGSLLNAAYDVIINATSASLQQGLPPLAPQLIGERSCCYDLMYSDVDTAFVTWAKSHGAALISDGLGMLVEQAAESFHIWHGVRPATASVIRMLRGA